MLQALPPIFAGLSPDDVQEASHLLQPVQLDAGEIVMEMGEQDSTLAFISQGVASVMVGDTRIGGAGARDVLGLPELFSGRPRLASVVASGPLQLLVLAPEGYEQLCRSGNPAVFNLERAALKKLSDHLRYFSEGIAEMSSGQPLELNPKTGFFHRISKSLRGRSNPDVDAATVLSQSSLFSWADGAILQQIGECFSVEAFEAEHVLCRQGENAERMWIVAEGKVEVVVMVGGERAEALATLEPGQAFGDAAMALGTPRSASCVCHQDVTALVLDREKYLELYSVDDVVGSTFRQGMARNLVEQLVASQTRYVELVQMRDRGEEQVLRGTPISSVWRD